MTRHKRRIATFVVALTMFSLPGAIGCRSNTPPANRGSTGAIPRGGVALGEEEIVRIGGVDVGDAPAVAQNIDGLMEVGERHSFGCEGNRGEQQEGRKTEQHKFLYCEHPH